MKAVDARKLVVGDWVQAMFGCYAATPSISWNENKPTPTPAGIDQ
jgi:hypothetical protein